MGKLTLSLLPFAPTVDGSVLPAAPLASFAAGQGGTVPLLIGSNRDEARLFLVAANTIDLIDEPTLAAVAGAYGLPADALAVYRASRPGASPGDLLAAVITDWFFRIPPIRVAEARVELERRRAAPGCTGSTTRSRRTTTGSAPATRRRSRSCSTPPPGPSSAR